MPSLSVNRWSICLWVFPSGVVQVYLWVFRCGNVVFLKTRFFDVAKFTILTLLSLLSCCRLSFPIASLKIFSLSTFALKSPNLIFIWCIGIWCNWSLLIFKLNKLYLLNPCSRVLLEKLTGSQLVKKFPALYGTRLFITAFTRARHLPIPSQINPVHAQHPNSWRSNVIFFSHLHNWRNKIFKIIANLL